MQNKHQMKGRSSNGGGACLHAKCLLFIGFIQYALFSIKYFLCMDVNLKFMVRRYYVYFVNF